MTAYSDAAGTIPTWTRGDKLRKARETAGLNQQQLADAIGISRRSVSTYESAGTSNRPVLRSWAAECNVPVRWLEECCTPDPDDCGHTEAAHWLHGCDPSD
jgi:transcriptional regulator with XRE-family HTH domain